ncbi:MAG: hypothetical protein E7646_08745 [Ruminococcaceae bacterium]|nr:hypothetical protein [Oscillospiraceae bacterium]
MKRFIFCILCIAISLSTVSCGLIDRYNGNNNEEYFQFQIGPGDQSDNFDQSRIDFDHAVVCVDGGWMKADSLSYVKQILEDRGLLVPQSLEEFSLESYESYLESIKKDSHSQEGEAKGDSATIGDIISDENSVAIRTVVVSSAVSVGGLRPGAVIGIVGGEGDGKGDINVIVEGDLVVGGDGIVGIVGGVAEESDAPFAVMFVEDALRYMDLVEASAYLESDSLEEFEGVVIVRCDSIGDESFWGGKGVSDGDAAADCEHDWVVPDPDQYNFCTAFREVCALCGEFRGEFVSCEYNVEDYTCTETANCIHCGKPNEDYDIPGHTMIEASCEHPRMCEICGYSEGEALGHTGGKATCTEYAICTRCNWFYGEVLGHEYVNGHCWRCGDDDPNAAPDTSQIPDNDNIKVSHFGPIPFQLHTAKIEAATYEVEGTSIFVTVTVCKTIGDGDVDFGWILYGGGYDDLCKGNETTPFLKEGETVNYLFEIPNAITSEFNSYKVYLGYGYNI